MTNDTGDRFPDDPATQPIVERVFDLTWASLTDLARTAETIEETMRRLRSEPLPDLIWDSESRP